MPVVPPTVIRPVVCDVPNKRLVVVPLKVTAAEAVNVELTATVELAVTAPPAVTVP